MEFDIRAISLAESIAADARVELADLLGTTRTFRQGIQIPVTLPDSIAKDSEEIAEPTKILTCLSDWARVYRHPEAENDLIHVLSPADDGAGGLIFYRVDLRQPPVPKKGLRPAVEIVGCFSNNYDECAAWLTDLAYKRATDRDRVNRYVVLSRPSPISPARIRMACVCPEVIANRAMLPRLVSIGQVFGAEIVHITPRDFRYVAARLAGALPLDAVLFCPHFAPFITDAAVPEAVPPELIHFCDSESEAGIEQQVRAWIELSQTQIESRKAERRADAGATLLAVMLRGMLNHSKIGQFNHCDRATVLTGVARDTSTPLKLKSYWRQIANSSRRPKSPINFSFGKIIMMAASIFSITNS